MKSACRLLILFFGLLLSTRVHAQNPLPDLSVRELTRGKIQVSWYSPERNCIQVAVQRSTDSSKNFRTIVSAQSPELMNNGYVDNKPPVGRAYYRIFYVLQGGAYFFTRAVMVETQPPAVEKTLPVMEMGKEKNLEYTTIYIKNTPAFRLTKDEYKHFKDSINKTKDALHRIDEHAVEWRPVKTEPKKGDKKEMVRVYIRDMLLTEVSKKDYPRFKDSIKMQTKDTLFVIDQSRIQLHPFIVPVIETVFIYRNDSLLLQLETEAYKKFKDSIAMRTKDTLFATDRNRVEIHPFRPKYAWIASKYIYTNNKGYVIINLPLVKQHRYHVVFFEEDGSELFRIKAIKEPELILDKTDFIHAGWFSFELFEDDKLKEKNKLLLLKE
jgi:hypothetical protein